MEVLGEKFCGGDNGGGEKGAEEKPFEGDTDCRAGDGGGEPEQEVEGEGEGEIDLKDRVVRILH